VQTLVAAWEPVWHLAFSPAGGLYAPFSAGVYAWPNPGAGGPPVVLPYPEREQYWDRGSRRVGFSRGGGRMLLDGANVVLHDEATGRGTPVPFDAPLHPFVVAELSPDGGFAVFVQSQSGWPARSRIIGRSLADPTVNAWTVDEGRYVDAVRVLADGDRFLSFERPGTVHDYARAVTRDLRTGAAVGEQHPHEDLVRRAGWYARAAASGDRRRMAAFQDDGVAVFDPADVTAPPVVLTNKPRRPAIAAVAFPPAADRLAVTVGQAVKVFDLRTRKVVRTLTWNVGNLVSLAFSADGTLAAAGTDAGRIVVWDI
jgi:WD40 repeat protein